MAWDVARNAQDYQLQYGRHPYSLVEGADTIVTGNSCLIDNLSAATGYDIYVRTRCDQEWYAADYVSILNVFTQSSSGVEAIDPSDDLILTPNPAHSHLSIIIKEVSSQAELTIHDAAGRKVRHLALRSSSSAVFDIADLPSGIYFVTLTTPIGSATKKLVKQ